ncbi:MAG: type 4a pilus biogenesis protein PilO [Desulfobulbales bacterium]|nr:type 4a pilus biogenesis protein PilO [Desulfobulbales bacterium]
MKEKITKIKQAYGSFLDNKLTRLSKKQKIGILAGSLMAPLLLFFFLIYSPKSKEIDKLEKDIRYLKGEIQKVEEITNKIEEHRAEKQRVELRLKAASLLLPKEKEIPNLLTDISEQGTGSGLEFISFTPRPERREQFYAIIPVAINVNGSYHQIGTFLDRISKLNRIVTVDNISLGGARPSGNEMLLTATLELVTYRFIDAPQ